MKILKVSFRNLNSLTGSHEIDLSNGPLADAGIFAITGPTGSGKSTILDAITLALYGRAARYGSVSNPADMMSRHTGDCSAEVVFEVPDGRFRAAWHLNRARKKFDGNVQQAKRYLYDANDQPLAQKITEVNQMITRLVGLDADRFLRSVLLAQNEFARFLRSSADERAMLLESLTGTEVYSRLGILTHQLHAKKENELKSQLQQIDTIELLEAGERKKVEDRIDSTKNELAAKTKKLETTRDEINRGVQLEKLVSQQQTLEANRSALEKETANFAESAKRLELHMEALHFRDDLNAIDRMVKSHESSQAHAKEAEDDLAAVTTRLKCVCLAAESLASRLEEQTNEQLAELHKQRAENEVASKSLGEWLQEHAVDAELISAMGEISVALEKLSNSRKSLKDCSEQEKSLAEKARNTESEITRLTESLNAAKKYKAEQEKSVDDAKTLLERVSVGKTVIQLETEIERKREIQQGLRELSVMIQQYDDLQEKQRVLQEKIATLRDTKEKAERRSQEAKALATKQLQLVESLQESHNRGVLIAKLQDHRHDLEDGQPCPLCGALEHPYAASSPITDSRLKEEAKKLRDAGAEHKRLDMKRTDAEKDVIRSEHKLDSESRIFDAGRRQSEEEKAEILAKAESVGLVDPDRERAAAEIDLQTVQKSSLEKQLAAMRETIEQIAHLETRVVEADGKLEVAKSDLAHEKSKVDALQNEIQAAKKKAIESENLIAADSQHVIRLLENYLPDNDRLPDPNQESNLRETLAARCDAFREAKEKQQILIDALRSFSDREKQLLSEKDSITRSAKSFRDVSLNESDLLPEDSAESETIRGEVVAMCADWNTIDQAQHEIDSLRSASQSVAATATERKSKVAQSAEELRLAREAFAARVGESQFENIDVLRTAMLSDEAFAELDSARTNMATRLSENRGELKSVVDSLAALREQQTPSGEELVARREQVAQQEAELNQFQKLVTELEMQIRNDDKNRELHEDRSREVQEELRRMESWRKLRGLIGSADGKKFRLFAQGLTLDVLVRLANRHLNKLTSRYQLLRVEGEQLDLEICDLHQAGTRRPMKSLSGGESFVASLALALGLSDLAGRNVRIDSLFIDEGFGSLDPDTLDVAVAALEGLQASNKTIGVISHVELLKERITTQIRVVPGGGGVSELQIVG